MSKDTTLLATNDQCMWNNSEGTNEDRVLTSKKINGFKIALLITLFAVMYGILHDQITARVCLEYFTVAHPPILHINGPTMIGLFWGIAATWWPGLFVGIMVAIASNIGVRPIYTARTLIRPALILLLVMSGSALTAGLVGYTLTIYGIVRPVLYLTEIQTSKHAAFMADAFAHSASYLIGFLGSVVILVHVWRARSKF